MKMTSWRCYWKTLTDLARLRPLQKVLVRLLLVLALYCLLLSAQSAPVMPDPDTLVRMLCVKVVDGDTAWFVEENYATHKVRFIGIDTPETVHPTVGVQPFGEEASAYTTDALLGQYVYLEADIELFDRYVRDGIDTVTIYPPNVKYVDYLSAPGSRA